MICLCLLTTSFSSAITIFSVSNVPDENAERDNSIQLSYSFEQPCIEKKNLFDEITMSDLMTCGLPGEPVMPLKSIKVLLPPGSTVYTIEISPGRQITIPGSYKLIPGEKPVPLNYQGSIEPTLPDPLIYESNTPYPGFLYEDIGMQSFRGYNILFLNLYPVQYVPKTGQVYYYDTLEVKITPTSSKTTMSAFFRDINIDKNELINKVDDTDALSQYDGFIVSKDDRSPSRSLVDPADTYKYVVITNEELKNSNGEYTFQDLIQSKINKGLPATIVTVEDIEACPDYWWNGQFGDGNPIFNDTACHIRNFIKDAYQNWETEYVLLGGDGDGADVGGESGDNIIPARLFASPFYGDCSIAADMYYACLDGSFDSNHNGIFGQLHDGQDINPVTREVDLLAEVYVGRAPVDNQQELSNFVRKTLAYEQSNDPYLRDVCLVGEYSGFGGNYNWGSDLKDEIINGSSRFGYTTVGIPPEYHINTLYDKYWAEMGWPQPHSGGYYVTGGFPKEDMISAINNGVHIINHIGHGGNTHIMKLDEPVSINWTTGEIYGECHDILNLTNDQYFFGYSFTCFAGSFDNFDHPESGLPGDYLPYDSIVEKLVTSEHGAFAFIANTRYGVGAPNTDAAGQRFDRQFFDALFGENIRNLGKANQDSKEDNIPIISREDIRFCYYELTLFGDPEIAIKNSPVLNFTVNIPGGPYTGVVGSPIYFTGSATSGVQPYTWQWDFGDGNISTEQNPQHNYSQAGEYQVMLTVTDSIGNTATNTTTATITEPEPLESFTNGPYSGVVGQAVSFSGGAVGGVPPYRYFWTFGDGNSSFGQYPQHNYSQVGEYQVMVIAIDSSGNGVANFTTASIAESLKAFVGGPYTGVVGEMIQFQGDASGGFLPYTWYWDFGDGSTSYLQNPTHNYTNENTYTVTLTVTDAVGHINRSATTALIRPWPVHNLNKNTYYAAIQAAIDDADSGDTIFVYAGTYYENIVVNKTINLIGENKNTTIIDGFDHDDTIFIIRDGVTIAGFTIQNSGHKMYYNTREIYCIRGLCGIYVFESNNCTITNNIIQNNGIGIWLHMNINSTISDNILIHDGIYIYGRNYDLHNVIDNRSYWDSHTIYNNTANGLPIRYYKHENNLVVPSDTGQVILVNCTNSTIQCLNLSHVDEPILVAFSSHVNVSKNSLTNVSFHGIDLSYSSNISVYENFVIAYDEGIWIGDSDNNILSRNHIIGNPCEHSLYYCNSGTGKSYVNNGIVAELYGSHNVISHNIVENFIGDGDVVMRGYSDNFTFYANTLTNSTGISIGGRDHHVIGNIVTNNTGMSCGSNSLIVGNTITNNIIGLFVSSNSLIVGNTIADNTIGMKIYYSSSGNKIYHNSFINNTNHTLLFPSSSNNIWNDTYPSGGNYWDNYTGRDDNQDGIGDTPYNISGKTPPNQDRYPLVYRFILGDMNVDGVVNWRDVDPFVLAMSDPATYQSQYRMLPTLHGDLTGDGVVNWRDIDPFIVLLNGG